MVILLSFKSCSFLPVVKIINLSINNSGLERDFIKLRKNPSNSYSIKMCIMKNDIELCKYHQNNYKYTST